MNYINFIKSQNAKNNYKQIPYIIAEAGVNHEGNLETAKILIEQAQKGGANAIKFQSYKANKLSCQYINKKEKYQQFEYLKRHDKFWKKEYETLKTHCDKSGIEFLSTAFDFESAKFLSELVNAFKIASSDITHKPLIKYISSFQKPIILSTGGCYISEIDDAINWIKQVSKVNIAILHCIINYPVTEKNTNLNMIRHLKKKYKNHIIGYSDHSLSENIIMLERALLLGASIIEKHFTHNKKLTNNDHTHSMDKNDLIALIKNNKNLINSLGEFEKKPIASEKEVIKHSRRSVVAKKFIAKNKVIDIHDLDFKRPAYGISPKFTDIIIGKATNKDINEDSIIHWNDLA